MQRKLRIILDYLTVFIIAAFLAFVLVICNASSKLVLKLESPLPAVGEHAGNIALSRENIHYSVSNRKTTAIFSANSVNDTFHVSIPWYWNKCYLHFRTMPHKNRILELSLNGKSLPEERLSRWGAWQVEPGMKIENKGANGNLVLLLPEPSVRGVLRDHIGFFLLSVCAFFALIEFIRRWQKIPCICDYFLTHAGKIALAGIIVMPICAGFLFFAVFESKMEISVEFEEPLPPKTKSFLLTSNRFGGERLGNSLFLTNDDQLVCTLSPEGNRLSRMVLPSTVAAELQLQFPDALFPVKIKGVQIGALYYNAEELNQLALSKQPFALKGKSLEFAKAKDFSLDLSFWDAESQQVKNKNFIKLILFSGALLLVAVFVFFYYSGLSLGKCIAFCGHVKCKVKKNPFPWSAAQVLGISVFIYLAFLFLRYLIFGMVFPTLSFDGIVNANVAANWASGRGFSFNGIVDPPACTTGCFLLIPVGMMLWITSQSLYAPVVAVFLFNIITLIILLRVIERFGFSTAQNWYFRCLILLLILCFPHWASLMQFIDVMGEWSGYLCLVTSFILLYTHKNKYDILLAGVLIGISLNIKSLLIVPAVSFVVGYVLVCWRDNVLTLKKILYRMLWLGVGYGTIKIGILIFRYCILGSLPLLLSRGPEKAEFFNGSQGGGVIYYSIDFFIENVRNNIEYIWPNAVIGTLTLLILGWGFFSLIFRSHAKEQYFGYLMLFAAAGFLFWFLPGAFIKFRIRYFETFYFCFLFGIIYLIISIKKRSIFYHLLIIFLILQWNSVFLKLSSMYNPGNLSSRIERSMLELCCKQIIDQFGNYEVQMYCNNPAWSNARFFGNRDVCSVAQYRKEEKRPAVVVNFNLRDSEIIKKFPYLYYSDSNFEIRGDSPRKNLKRKTALE